jgi:ATP-dependent DNA ligase
MKLDALKKKNGYLEGMASLADSAYANLGSSTKKKLRTMVPLCGDEIAAKCEDGISLVTTKLDGEMGVLVYDGNDCILINSGDTARAGLAVLDEAKTLLKKAGITSATLGCELYVKSDKREKVAQVSNALSSKDGLNTLALAVFDIYELDGKPFAGEYSTTNAKITDMFSTGKSISAVPMKQANSKKEIEAIYADMVTNAGAEGIVVRSSSSIVYKIKPKHSIDCAIVGYTESESGGVRDILLALLFGDNEYQIIGKVGNGIDEATNKELYGKLSALVCESEHLEVDGRRVAFRFVKPQYVVQISATDVSNETMDGPIQNPLVRFDGNGYKKVDNMISVAGISLIHCVFERLRDDKKADGEDVRLAQVSDYIVSQESGASKEKPKSEMVAREVYTKSTKDKLAVQKFIVYKTNKGDGKAFLEYVFYYTNFSEGRQELFKNEIRTSNSKEQIMKIFDSYKEENIKKGWDRA